MKSIERILTLLMLMIFSIAYAQKAELAAIHLYANTAKEMRTQPKINLVFLVNDSVQIVGIDESLSHVSVFKDNRRTDLKKVSNEYPNTIDFKDSQVTKYGFAVSLISNTLPHKKANRIHIKATIVYKVLTQEPIKSKILKNILFEDIDAIEWLGKSTKLTKRKRRDSVKGELIDISFSNQDLNADLNKIEVLDDNDKVIREIKLGKYTNFTQFSLRHVDQPLHLKITYQALKNKIVQIDRKIGLGL
ncbi:hypothetical protein [Spongiivirga citrea]|uniref:Uncharacterized protein n=1 Tax=Spongiivirga citrea TaxID=1481457 RepID=A0A6M0CHS8_9FLAO|nr:hypothetical protein [Spongiivirga citrea]NER17516.1 hypothetical protein [Spongiivirga citrea]